MKLIALTDEEFDVLLDLLPKSAQNFQSYSMGLVEIRTKMVMQNSDIAQRQKILREFSGQG